ncbi:hypothetical protein F383_24672 [Gossypium arboreum]|uniref:Uncharacterized protein n=1 Tax=Gossypium arboreum TaxID=29729 RepID=A0A0B0PB49_GOSAR|nr:hypothetical protein F383_24672 [Gossypium arboreum]
MICQKRIRRFRFRQLLMGLSIGWNNSPKRLGLWTRIWENGMKLKWNFNQTSLS